VRNASIVILPQTLLAGAVWLWPSPAAGVLLALWAAVQALVLTALLRPRSTLFGPNLWRGPQAPRVALTFDDGPHPEDTPAILDILEATGVPATFFFVADRARAHPDLVQRVARAGHTVGVHSMTHPWWFSLAGPGRLRREVGQAAAVIADLSGRRSRYFRPPMGHKNVFLGPQLGEAGLTMVTWSARSFDTLGVPPATIRDILVSRAGPGGILLLHEGVRRHGAAGSPAVAALPGIIEGLRARGLEMVSLENLR